MSAKEALQKTATSELQRLRDTAAQATSIAHIEQARRTAEPAYDLAWIAIEQSQIVPDSDEPTPPMPKVKKRRVVEVKNLWADGFIENTDHVDTFLTKLRSELEAALAADERVQIK